jgi:hypothetical protein
MGHRGIVMVSAVAAMAAVGLTVFGGTARAGSAGRSAIYEVPPYFVEIAANGNPDVVPSYAVVRATATGQLLATVKPTPGYTVLGVWAAADDRRFVLDEAKWIGYRDAGHPQSWQPRSYFLVRLNSRGAAMSVIRLPVTTVGLVTGVALSADATKLAIAVRPRPDSEYNPEQVRIYTLATGAVRTWAAQGTSIGAGQTQTGLAANIPDDTESLSWTADGTRLAFDWTPFPNAGPSGTWLLNTTRGGGNLLADSRLVPVTGCAYSLASSPTCEGDTIITPDGSALVCGATSDSDLFGPQVTDDYLEFSTATGKARVFGSFTFINVHEQAFGVRWSNSSGSILIASLPGSGAGLLAIIKGSTVTPLSVPDDAIPWMNGTW